MPMPKPGSGQVVQFSMPPCHSIPSPNLHRERAEKELERKRERKKREGREGGRRAREGLRRPLEGSHTQRKPEEAGGRAGLGEGEEASKGPTRLPRRHQGQ